MGSEVYEPPGFRFNDARHGEMLLVQDDSSGWNGWLFYRHPDGQWVSLRKATDDDTQRLESETGYYQ